MRDNGETSYPGWEAWEPTDLPATASAVEVAQVIRAGYDTYSKLPTLETIDHHMRAYTHDWHVSMNADVRTGEHSYLTALSVVEDNIDCAVERDGGDIPEALALAWVQREREANEPEAIEPTPLPSRDDAATWIARLADSLIDDNGDTRVRGVDQIGKLHAIVESVGSFLAGLAEDTRNATDAADYGRRVAQSLTGLLGGLNGDIGGAVEGTSPWTFAVEVAS